MSSITLAIVIAFILGYACIATESFTRVNKAAVALFMFVACWTLFVIDAGTYFPELSGEALIAEVNNSILNHLGDTSTTLFFLMGAMTIVEIVDQNGGFNFVGEALKTQSKRALLWRIAFLTFFLSAVLDNMTTTIVMIMVLRKLVYDYGDRILYASLVVIAANAGGAFSPIGDVTTIMLWNEGSVSAPGIVSSLFLPSIASIVVPCLLLQYQLKGELVVTSPKRVNKASDEFTSFQRKTIFLLGVGGLIFVPVFKYFTNLPPFVGILLVLSVLWIVTEVFYRRLKHITENEEMSKRVSNLLSHIDMSTILFFLGILMAVSCLEEIGILESLGKGLNLVFQGNHYLVTGIIGVLSSIIDNVPLVAGCMGMYPLQSMGDFAMDGIFWELLAYCAGVGGSILIIGSAAGVVAMGLEKISFGWYMKHISWIALVGYLAGIACYYLQQLIL